jgi:hypothetical protein
VKRPFIIVLFIIAIFLAAPLARESDGGGKPAVPPIGMYTWDDGNTVLVGVGTTKPLATLDVTRGEVKIGSTGTACGAKLAGTLRFAESKLQLCDGISWRNVSLEKAQ